MAIIEEGSCLIESLNKKGLGCGKTDIGIVEVPYALPGEMIAFEKHGYRKKINSILKEVEKPSVHRITPECKYFGRCGGCMMQHMDFESYNEFKLGLVQKYLPSKTKINPIVSIPKGNRRRANLQAVKKDDRVILGFYLYHSHQIIDIDSCPAILGSLTDLILPLKKALQEFLCNREKAEIFIAQASNGIDILIELKESYVEESRTKILADFAKEIGVIRLQIGSPENSKVIFETAEPYIVLGDKKVAIDTKCFMQASFQSDQILADMVLKYLSEEKGNLVDLFCGRGTFSLPLSKRFSVTGFEFDESSIEALDAASEGAIKLHKRDLFASPLSAAELDEYQFAVINPPRAGSLGQVKRLAKSNAKKIIYVSCNPESFARDAKILEDGGYNMLEVTPVDQFYWSAHMEIVGVFERESNS